MAALSPLASPKALASVGKTGTPVELVAEGQYKSWAASQSAGTQAWLAAALAKPKDGSHALLPGSDGRIKRVVVVTGDAPDIWALAALPLSLPVGVYQLQARGLDDVALLRLCLGWGLGAYQFTRYRPAERAPAQLALSAGVDAALLQAMLEGICLARDLINTPAGDLGPSELAQAAVDLAKRHGGKARVIVGDALLRENFPLIHTVGRAAEQAPRLIDFTWGNPKHPKVTLVGKGVTFDTGGLDIKSADGMYNMKDDMGGSASVLATAHMIMSAKLPVRLRVLIGAVENAIGPTAMRPRDVVKSRAGVTVEIQDTDAEGRLILADMLALAAEETPAVLVDMATLTGTTIRAIGYDLGGMMTPATRLGDESAAQLAAAGTIMGDPLWRLPIWDGYAHRLDSTVADTMSCASGGLVDEIMAAIFLQRFALPGKAKDKTTWIHLDMGCFHQSSRPGRPEGGEAQGARAVFWWLKQRFGA